MSLASLALTHSFEFVTSRDIKITKVVEHVDHCEDALADLTLNSKPDSFEGAPTVVRIAGIATFLEIPLLIIIIIDQSQPNIECLLLRKQERRYPIEPSYRLGGRV